jgi:hypothetical protein
LNESFMESAMPEDRKTLRYRVLRYAPNLIRDEWVNIGILLEEFQELEAVGGSLRAIRVIEEDREFARVRKLHPSADVELLHGLASEFETLRSMTGEDMRKYFTRPFSRKTSMWSWPVSTIPTLHLPPEQSAEASWKVLGHGFETSSKMFFSGIASRQNSSRQSVSMNIPTRAIRLNLTTAIGMASAGTFSPWFSTAMRRRPRFWLTPLKA